MSIQLFPKVGGATGGRPAYLAEDGSEYTGAYAEYQVKVTVRTGTITGARRSSISEFGVKAANQDACDLAAGNVMQIIDNLSSGYVTQFWKKLGAFRQDDDGSAIGVGSSSYVVKTWTNSITEQNPSGNAAETEMSGQLYIPFCSEDVYISGKASLNALITGGTLCRARFKDDTRDSFLIATSQNIKTTKLLEYTTATYGTLTSNDTSAGISDGVLRDRS